jgi:hypothetical protein
LDSDLTVEFDNECYPAELRIAGETYDSLDDGHPVIFVMDGEDQGRISDIPTIRKEIGLLNNTRLCVAGDNGCPLLVHFRQSEKTNVCS